MNKNPENPEMIKNKRMEEKIFPASDVQRQIWSLQKAHPEITAYNIPFAFKVTGKFDKEVYSNAINMIIKRHEIYRTYFGLKENILFQFVKQEYQIDIPIIDIKNYTEEKQEEAIKSEIQKELKEPFNLTKPGLFRNRILEIKDNEFIILLSFHQIITDHATLSNFTKELSKIYEAELKNTGIDLSKPVLQYSDLIIYQQQEDYQIKLRSKIQYWDEHLKGVIPSLEMSSDKMRSSDQTMKGREIKFRISPEISKNIRELSLKENISLFVLLLSAFKILIFKYSHQNEIVVGSPFPNREVPGSEDIAGCVMNTLPLKTTIDEEEDFISYSDKVKDVVKNAELNQEVPFEQIINIVNSKRDTNYNPLLQVNFIYQKQPMVFTLPDCEIRALDLHNGYTQFDINIIIWEAEKVFEGSFVYSKDLFNHDTALNIVKHFQVLLCNITMSPTTKIKDLNMVTCKEKSLLCKKWNNTVVDYPKNKLLNNLFEEQSFKSPNTVAVQFENKSINYCELNKKVNQVANYLNAKGLKENDIVGVCINRSELIPLLLLGINRAGGTYLPMDPTFPKDRLEFMIEDSSLKMVFTNKEYVNLFPASADLILVDDLNEILKSQSENKPDVKGKPDNVVYIIYTSGSTGKPKGVKIRNYSLVNFLLSMQKKPGLKPSDVLAAITTLSFDIAGLEIFLPLITGATVLILSKYDAMDGNIIKKKIDSKGVTIMQATPATWKLLLEANWKNPNKIKMLCGGEALTKDLADKLLAIGGELWNMYGPTETCIWSSIEKIELQHNEITIGRPIDNTTFYVFDKDMNMVPPGIEGELYIGGDGVAEGYLNREELTKEKFIPNPINNKEVIYRTGDIAKFHTDGRVQCLGRVDFQVKIRGFRIELGEIESELKKNDQIKETVVVAKEDSSGLQQLIAFIIPREGHEISTNQIKEFLQLSLPDYMIPSIYMSLTEFPLTPNNKIDRKALQNFSLPEIKVDKNEYAESDEILSENEKKLIDLWEDLLQRKGISVNDDFFEVGGHSLLAARMFSKIEVLFNVKLPLAILFNSPTIKGLLKFIENNKENHFWQPIVPIKETGTKTPLFLIHGAEGNVLFYRDLVKYMNENQPVYGLQSRGLNGLKDFNPEFEKTAKYYIEEIKKIQPQGPYCLGGYCIGGTLALEMARQLEEQGEETKLVAMFEAYNVSSNLKALVFPYTVLHKFQNVYFHIENYFTLDKISRKKFLSQKLDTARFRFKVRVNNIKSKITKDEKVREKYPHLIVQKINDEAEANYRPKPYHGKALLFRPHKYFVGFKDNTFGWNNYIQDLKVLPLKINPRGMMVEPYVKDVAKHLNEILNENQ